jgi:hypothetical protein
MSSPAAGRAVSKTVGEALESGTWIYGLQLVRAGRLVGVR